MDRIKEVSNRARQILIEIEDLERFIEENFSEQEKDIIFEGEPYAIIGMESEEILYRLVNLTELDLMEL